MNLMHYSFRHSAFQKAICLLVCVVIIGCDRQDGSDSAAQPETTSDQAADSRSQAEPSQSFESKLKSAFELYQERRSDEAIALVQQILVAAPDDPIALRLAVDIEKQRQNYAAAGELAVKAAEVNPPMRARLLITAFDCNLRCGEFTKAELNLKQAITAQPDASEPHRLLGQLLNSQGRRIEASQHIRRLIRLRDIQPNELLSLIDMRGPFLLTSFAEFHQDKPLSLFMLGQVRLEYASGREEIAPQLKTMEELIEKFPSSAAAAAFRCRMLADSGRHQELREALNDVPAGIEDQPEYWFAFGTLLAHDNKNDEAVRAFTEACRRDPTDRQSLRSIVDLLLSDGEAEQAKLVQTRLSELDRIFRLARDANAKDSEWISKTLAEHSRPWESTAWLMRAASMGGNLASVIPELDRRHTAITSWEATGTAEQRSSARLKQLLGFDANRWPMPERGAISSSATANTLASVDAKIEFTDVAEQVGIATSFVSGFPLDGTPFYPYQVNGGGLGVFDYNLDGKSDLYVTQSGGDPQVDSSSVANHLYRMLPDGTYIDVAEASGTADRRYGQGVCIGDINQDGFPDLLVANIGINTLYINQGDGSFREATDRLSDNPFNWTSSLGLADLDGDSLPEIIEINYIDDPDAYRVTCTENYLDCQPQRFVKSSDRVLRSVGDGTFAAWQSFENGRPSAKLGFGLVIANFDHKAGNDFFVSNDGDFNHYWVSADSNDPGESKFELSESASLFGCNIGRRGNSQACMGIAYGDFDRDGTLDLHVTNFYNEPVNLFMQTSTGIFIDQVSKYGLMEPSYGVLGFGTQSADFDNNGWLDLAVLNGHVYDGRFEGIPFRMGPQVMVGTSQGFRPRESDAIGPYWGEKRLGRTLALLDWNQDGKVDLLANHLDAPLALLQNESSSGNWLQVELVGTESERDAIGAEVRVRANDQSWYAWQTGGDGLMCTNESILQFGIGDQESISRLEVTWPSGRTQSFSDLKPNQRILVIEGEDDLHQRVLQ